MTVETDTDRTALLADFAITVTHLSGTFTAALSEAAGYQMDQGVSTDGVIQLLALTSDVAGVPVAEGDSVTIGVTAYTVDKIDSLADGLDVISLSA